MKISGIGRERGWGLFPNGWTGEVLQFVIEVWDDLRLPSGARLEPRITKLLTGAIIERYEHEDRDWFCVPEAPDWDEQGKEVSRTDIRLYPPGKKRRKVAFVFESKRLNIPKSNASEYAGKDGMMCFITGKYSTGLPCGAMLGYVMDGDIPRAHAAVSRAIVSKRAMLLLPDKGELAPSALLRGHKFHGETRHRLSGGDFVIYHLLLPARWNESAADRRSDN